VMDGDLNQFIQAYLLSRGAKSKKKN